MENNIDRVGQKLLLAFHGIQQPSPEILESIQRYKPAGLTLFRSMNMGTLKQVRNLTESLQRLAQQHNLTPFLICTDQEGGQLMAVGECTPLPGNMALGATRSAELAYKAGVVLGRELAALGINVDFAPSADVNINPKNPVIGTRSFGEDPNLVGELVASLIHGIQSQGVAATVKHFPGHGDTHTDSHVSIPVLTHNMERLREVELPPFAAAIRAGVKMVMTAHIGIQMIDGINPLPATLSPKIITGLLRQELGFNGVVVSDAMNMHAIHQGELLRKDALLAALAGIDLLLVSEDPEDHKRVYESLFEAVNKGVLKSEAIIESVGRIMDLKKWLSTHAIISDLSVIRCAEHHMVANEIAERAVTLVRDRKSLIPIQLASYKRIAVIVPEPQDLTPADTSSYIKPDLANEIRVFHPQVDGFSVSFAPDQEESSNLLSRLKHYDLIIVGTINACVSPNQAALVRALINTEISTIVIAMRLPYDLEVFPKAGTYLCTYSILEPALRAAAKALFGKIEITGKLPVKINSVDAG